MLGFCNRKRIVLVLFQNKYIHGYIVLFFIFGYMVEWNGHFYILTVELRFILNIVGYFIWMRSLETR